MVTLRQHDKILQAVARELLQPKGLTRKGRSRTWLDDHGWWIIVVEFQPSAWSRGAYLNVGAMWLFHPQTHMSFHHGYREHDHIGYRNDEQFMEASRKLCDVALAKVNEYRTTLDSLSSAERILRDSLAADCARFGAHADIWHLYFAGVVSGLLGDLERARDLLSETLGDQFVHPWQLDLKAESRSLLAACETAHFRTCVEGNISRCRELLKLPGTRVSLGA